MEAEYEVNTSSKKFETMWKYYSQGESFLDGHIWKNCLSKLNWFKPKKVRWAYKYYWRDISDKSERVYESHHSSF